LQNGPLQKELSFYPKCYIGMDVTSRNGIKKIIFLQVVYITKNFIINPINTLRNKGKMEIWMKG